MMKLHGLIQGPHESQEDFEARIALLEKVYQNPTLLRMKGLERHPALTYLDLDLDIDCLLVKRASFGGFFWEPAVTWIMEIDKHKIPVLQLGRSFNCLKEEMLKHEAVHIARAVFNEPIYEEFLAYATSSASWRRFWGPIFRSSLESVFFILTCCVPMIGVVISIPLPILLSIPVGYFLFLFLRLIWHQRIFRKALKTISTIFNEKNPLEIAISLNDQEIHRLSRICLHSIIKNDLANNTENI